MRSWHRVARLEELEEGKARLVEVEGELVMVVLDQGVPRATSAVCPHKFTMLTQGRIEGGCVTCPLHAATFSLATGEPMPGQQWAGWLPTFPVRVVDGHVEVEA